MAKLKHPATLIYNGQIIAKGVSFNKAIAAAEKIAGVSFQKGAARRRVKFYRGVIYRFAPENAQSTQCFAIVPTMDITYVQVYNSLEGKRVKEVGNYQLLENFWRSNCVPYCRFPGRYHLTTVAIFVLIGDHNAAECDTHWDYFERGHLHRELRMIDHGYLAA